MSRIAKNVWVILAAGTLVISACGAAGGNPTATTDAGTQLTAVALTVQAELTRSAGLTPTATNTPEPSATLATTATATEALVTATSAVTATVAQAGVGVPDKAEYVSQSVQDDSKFSAGNSFTNTWRIKNVGTTTWNTSYQARLYAGDAFGAPATMKLSKEVKPGETAEITMNMKAPSTSGSQTSIWVLTNADGYNFMQFFIRIEVTGSAAPTNTQAPAATNTVAPAATNTTAPTQTTAPTVAPTT